MDSGLPGQEGRRLEAPGEWGIRGAQGCVDLCIGESTICLAWPEMVGIPNANPGKVGVKGRLRKACTF